MGLLGDRSHMVDVKSALLEENLQVQVAKKDVVPVYQVVSETMIRRTLFTQREFLFIKSTTLCNISNIAEIPENFPKTLPLANIILRNVLLEFGETFLPITEIENAGEPRPEYLNRYNERDPNSYVEYGDPNFIIYEEDVPEEPHSYDPLKDDSFSVFRVSCFVVPGIKLNIAVNTLDDDPTCLYEIMDKRPHVHGVFSAPVTNKKIPKFLRCDYLKTEELSIQQEEVR